MCRLLREFLYQKYNLILLIALLNITIVFHYLIYPQPQVNHVVGLKRMYREHNMKLMVDQPYSNSTMKCTLLKTNYTLCREVPRDLPILYIITPTYKRPTQLAELTRLSQTLMLVPQIYWLVIEDATKLNPLVTELLESTGIAVEYLCAPMPSFHRRKKMQPKGVAARNKALEWIRKHAHRGGVLYFADDDNTYDIELFEEIRRTKRVSFFPVGLIWTYGISTPIIRHGRFAGFLDSLGRRKFMMDMAGFAVSVDFLLQRPGAAMPYQHAREEDGFLLSLAPLEPHELEPLADNCTRILVWHTQSKDLAFSPPRISSNDNTNLVKLMSLIT